MFKVLAVISSEECPPPLPSFLSHLFWFILSGLHVSHHDCTLAPFCTQTGRIVEFVAFKYQKYMSFYSRFLEKYWHAIICPGKSLGQILWFRSGSYPKFEDSASYPLNVLLDAVKGGRWTFLVCHDSCSNIFYYKRRKTTTTESPVFLLPRSCFLPFSFKAL